MRRNLLLQVMIIMTFGLHAQIVINEIMYNPPESGNDSLEYVEIYNANDFEVDITGYIFTAGMEYTFPGHMLSAGEYVVVCIDSLVLMNNFGVNAYQWTSGALSNGGEKIRLEDGNGNVIDEVDYMTAGGWPSTADGTAGEGASIELCDPFSDNNVGSNWGASKSSSGVMINGKDLRGTPVAENSPCGPPAPDYIVQTAGFTFDPADITIGVGETVQWQNTGGTHNVNGTQATFPSNPESFTSGSPSGELWTFQHTFTIAGVYNYQCDPHAAFGMTGNVTVISDVEPSNYPLRTIAEMSSLDANGVGDSLGVTCELIGVVYGINYRPGGLTFVIIDDSNDGMSVFKNSESLGYTVQEGDEVSIKGVMDQFSGLVQIVPDSVNVLSTGNALFDPTDVETLNEDTESQLIKLSSFEVVNASEWKGDGTDFNVSLSDGTNTVTMRIDKDVDLSTMGLPGTLLNVTGLGGQFDTSSPYDSGYQILPRYTSDIEVVLSANQPNIQSLDVYPNPFSNKLHIDADGLIRNVQVYNGLGAKVFESATSQNILDLGDLDRGVYYLRVTMDNGEIGVQRIHKQ